MKFNKTLQEVLLEPHQTPMCRPKISAGAKVSLNQARTIIALLLIATFSRVVVLCICV